MDAITRIKIQKQPKKDFLGETKAVVEEAMQQPQTAPVTPQPTNVQAVEQTPVATPKVAEKPLNQAELQAVNNPTPEQINTNNLIAGSKPSPGVPADYVKPTSVDFGGKLTSEDARKILDEQGMPGLWSAINKESAYEGQDEIDKRDKREKQRNLITSIADGLSSIANIGGTLAGGVNQKQTSLSEANTKRREYQRQLRERDRDKWQQMMMRTGEQQQNYELARRRQEIQYQDNILQHQYNKERIELENLREKRLMAKDERDAQLIDYRIGLLEAQANKTKADIENNRSKTEAYVNKSASDASANQTRAGASMKNANAAQQRANDNTIKTKAEIEGRKNGTWNQSSASGAGSGGKYTPVTAEEPEPPKQQPKNQPEKPLHPTQLTKGLGKYGLNTGDNKKHKQDPFK